MAALVTICALAGAGIGWCEERMAVFPFASVFDGGSTGARTATKFRMKLARESAFEVVSELETTEALGDGGADAGEVEELAKLARERLFAGKMVVGEVERTGRGYVIGYRLVDCAEGGARVVIDELSRAADDRGISDVAKAFVEELVGKGEEEEKGYEMTGENLLRNGHFEQGEETPVGWESIDGLTTQWAPRGEGKCLMMDTDVLERQWKEWRETLAGGAKASEAPAKEPTQEPKYDTVGGTYGVPFRSAYFKVEGGKRYAVSFDMKGRWIDGTVVFVAKAFIKGYAEVEGDRREVYRTYKACRTKTQGREWEHFERAFTVPEGVGWLRIQLYAYWPTGLYYWDNVEIREVRES